MIDYLPDSSSNLDKASRTQGEPTNIILASPCSGHGFKFCTVIGEILADLATIGKTDFEISLFSLNHR